MAPAQRDDEARVGGTVQYRIDLSSGPGVLLVKTQTTGIGQSLQRALDLHERGRLDEADKHYLAVLAAQPDHADALHFLGLLRLQQRRFDDAFGLIAQSLRLRPGMADAWCNQGTVLQALGRFEEAIGSYDRAMALQPAYTDAMFNRANALRALGRYADALISYDAVLASRPDFAPALANRGNVLQEMDRAEAALACYDRVLAIRPGSAEAFYNRGQALRSLGRFAEAVKAFEHARAVDPGFRYLLGDLAHTRAQICDWRDYDVLGRSVSDGVAAGRPVSLPFVFTVRSDDPAAQLRCAQAFVRDQHPAAPEPLWRGEVYRHDRIRVAYLSADFHDHATAYLMAGLFELHDRSRFEISAMSFGPDRASNMRSRLVAAFDRFIDVRERSDASAAKLLRELEIDIVVDLKGHTDRARQGILAYRPAPIQVNYLGYPGTTGAPYIDYILADRFVIPETDCRHYSEKVAYLPDCYQVNDSRDWGAREVVVRSESGLPDDAFVFCCFNNSYKITPRIFDIWMRLLQRTDGSVLWLLSGEASVSDNLRSEARRRKVDPRRLVFAERASLDRHLARHKLANVFLDTVPCNAHTTASDALRAGLPVVTCAGTTFAGRVAGSLLRTAGLPQLVASSLDEYEALALRLATQPGELQELAAELRAKVARSPLFGTARSCRHLESAYTSMWHRLQSGLEPIGFAVEPIA